MKNLFFLFSFFTVIAAICRNVLYLQSPLAPGVLVPGVDGHEGPVLEALWGVIIGSGPGGRHTAGVTTRGPVPRRSRLA